MDLRQLCEGIGLAEPVTGVVLAVEPVPDEILCKLRKEATWEVGRGELRAHLGPDPDGFRCLAASLQCALKTWEHYQEKGISREVFFATMACFSRFVEEHLESYGRYGFDRDFWTTRQLSGVLLRVGELEYEMLETDQGKVVSIHIPSDAALEREKLRRSWEDFRTLAERIFPDYAKAPMGCRSWLLSPTLRELLPPGSRILEFQAAFDIQPLAPSDSYKLWVFKDPGLAVEAFPEHTSLQRRLKAHLLSGGVFLNGQGRLKEESFR